MFLYARLRITTNPYVIVDHWGIKQWCKYRFRRLVFPAVMKIWKDSRIMRVVVKEIWLQLTSSVESRLMNTESDPAKRSSCCYSSGQKVKKWFVYSIVTPGRPLVVQFDRFIFILSYLYSPEDLLSWIILFICGTLLTLGSVVLVLYVGAILAY